MRDRHGVFNLSGPNHLEGCTGHDSDWPFPSSPLTPNQFMWQDLWAVKSHCWHIMFPGGSGCTIFAKSISSPTLCHDLFANSASQTKFTAAFRVLGCDFHNNIRFDCGNFRQIRIWLKFHFGLCSSRINSIYSSPPPPPSSTNSQCVVVPC